jgi:hypothetical protein
VLMHFAHGALAQFPQRLEDFQLASAGFGVIHPVISGFENGYLIN